MQRILLVLTSADDLAGSTEPTGYWLEEVAAPYYVFADAGYPVDLASPAGGTPPRDPESNREEHRLEASRRFDADPEASGKLRSTLRLSDVRLQDYDALFFAGGHGTMTDFPSDSHIIRLVEQSYAAGKPLASVCHGPACLVGARDEEGHPIIRGKRFTCFTDEEERSIGAEHHVPFLLQSRLEEQGGIFAGAAPFAPCVVTDGVVITGQNPASSTQTAEAVLAALAKTAPGR